VRVRLSPNALADLQTISRWIDGDNPERARSFSAGLRAACSTLGNHPSRFPIAFARSGLEVRKRVHGAYLIFYRIGPTEVEVLRIVHGARDWVAMFEQERK
jgi:toxin ParE1/3/4